MLKSEPSLEIYCDSGDGFIKSEDPVIGIEENLERTVTIGDSIDSSDFSFAKHKEEEGESVEKGKGVFDRESLEIERPPSPPMHLAAGLGIDKFDLFGNETKFDLPSFDDEGCDDYYKRMLDEYPVHPLLLKNYAKFLEYKGDVSGAEEYYHKCTVVEPSDGVALANYGRLVMKLHQDEAKASSYFERAVQASPEDSSRLSESEDGETLCRYAKAFWSISGDHEKALFYFEKAVQASPNDRYNIILGEYARFLWEIEE
ncbi:unnamed protein product [Arabis nemorensis]|uniref:Uncharacterized protein n=1 Tax=Arabis nemorensis TaxID=586526 RepID=A0A565ALR3_9BRAS|nr:unnamed protein product [Arabis nemorensis]